MKLAPMIVTALALAVARVAIAQEAAAPPPGDVEAVADVPGREVRPFAVGAELGWNGLGGAGLFASWRRHRIFALDVAVGRSLNGPKGGVRARLSKDHAGLATGTVGLGISYADGSDWDLSDSPPSPFLPMFAAWGDRTTHVSIGPTAYLQAVAGLQLRGRLVDATLLGGYSWTVAGHRVRSGTPLNEEQRDWVESATGRGLVLAVTLAGAFGGD